MAITVLKQLEATLSGGGGYREIYGIAQFTGTNLTGTIPAACANIFDVDVQPIGVFNGTLYTPSANLGSISATTSFLLVAPIAGVISAAQLFDAATAAASDTNFWQIGIVNKSNASAVVVDSTAAANSTKATGGAAITAYTAFNTTLSGTPANLVVNKGDILEVTITKNSAPTTLTETFFQVVITAPGGDEEIFNDNAANVNSFGALQPPTVGGSRVLTISRCGTNVLTGRLFSFRYRGY